MSSIRVMGCALALIVANASGSCILAQESPIDQVRKTGPGEMLLVRSVDKVSDLVVVGKPKLEVDFKSMPFIFLGPKIGYGAFPMYWPVMLGKTGWGVHQAIGVSKISYDLIEYKPMLKGFVIPGGAQIKRTVVVNFATMDGGPRPMDVSQFSEFSTDIKPGNMLYARLRLETVSSTGVVMFGRPFILKTNVHELATPIWVVDPTKTGVPPRDGIAMIVQRGLGWDLQIRNQSGQLVVGVQLAELPKGR